MTDKLLPCPFCGGEAIVVKTESCGRYIGCWDCGGRTEEFKTEGNMELWLLGVRGKPNYAGSAHDKAIAAWNRRAEPENEPLVRCGECAKYQSPNCAAKHEQALMDFCSHGVRKPERSKGE